MQTQQNIFTQVKMTFICVAGHIKFTQVNLDHPAENPKIHLVEKARKFQKKFLTRVNFFHPDKIHPGDDTKISALK